MKVSVYLFVAFVQQTSSFALKSGTVAPKTSPTFTSNSNGEDRAYWKIAPTLDHPEGRPLTPMLQEALETNTHPVETQEELGNGICIESDWREAYASYESPVGNPDLIDPVDGYASYEMEVEGTIPKDLKGTLYRNGPGKFGINGQRVSHVLDADGLIIKVAIEDGKASFMSRFVQTESFQQEREAGQFLQRRTFGTGPLPSESYPGVGINEEPSELPLIQRIIHRGLKTDIKNSANTQVIAFGGKLLALFEAGLPHRLDPKTLETMGEEQLDGNLPSSDRLPVKMSSIPEELMPETLNGASHTAHPKTCPRTGNLIGWHWTQVADQNALEVTITEWEKDTFAKIGSETYTIPGCVLAPHDMALTENYVFLKINSMKMDSLAFMSGLKAPAASLGMDGRAPVSGVILPRPTSSLPKKLTQVSIPPCFSIHFSHAYEHPVTNNLVTFFTGWPPSDSKEFLGAWGGHSPVFSRIPVTWMWRLEVDPSTAECVHLDVAPGCQNVCCEHPVTNPLFRTKRTENVYVASSNIIGDSTQSLGYSRLRVEDGSTEKLERGQRNEDCDSYWFGSRYFAEEPLVVPKLGANPNNEDAAYLLGMVKDGVANKSFLAVFDLERPLKEGPVAKLWMKSGVPRGLHGCFVEGATDGSCPTSYFC